jgi:hexulose-6-phosphate isomerase
MQVGITQMVLPQLPVAEFAAQAAAANYEVVELSLKREGEITPDLSEAQLSQIAADVRGAGVEPVSLVHGHTTGNLLESGDAQRASIDETMRGLQVAKAMGIGCTLHTLGRIDADLYYDDAYANAVFSLKEIAREAERLGVDLAVEFVWNGFLFSPLEMKRFLDEVGSTRIGFYFDPGNMAVFQFPQHWARITGAHIKMVHVKDWQGRALSGGWTPLLEGEVDFSAVMRELRAAGYDGPLISEVSVSDAPIEDTAKAIRKIIAL